MKQKCYTKYRVRPEKTPRQVRKYIRRQAWYASFKDLVTMDWDRPLWKRLRTLWGFEYAMTIAGAFDWDKTVQGRKHWQIINETFTAWFEGKYPSFK